jgi:ribonuclease HII
MEAFEQALWERNFRLVAGVDEAGRGSLAGPVVAAAVIFDPDHTKIDGVDDSKKLSPKTRETLFVHITESARTVGIGIVEHTEIDRINILQATLKAMQIALNNLSCAPDYVLIDGKQIPILNCPCTPIIKGDARVYSIAAASIIAKVTRDRIMTEYDSLYPHYGFKQNKGYGSKSHRDSLFVFGLSPLHRVTFCKRIIEPQMELWKQ